LTAEFNIYPTVKSLENSPHLRANLANNQKLDIEVGLSLTLQKRLALVQSRHGYIIAIPSFARSGQTRITDTLEIVQHETGELRQDIMTSKDAENCIVLIFVERHQAPFYLQAIENMYINVGKSVETHFIVLLPEGWERRGIPCAREAIRLFMTAIHNYYSLITNYFQIDDDISGFSVWHKDQRQDILTIEALMLLRKILIAQKTGIIAATPLRLVIEKEEEILQEELTHIPSLRCEKCVILDILRTPNACYVPSRWLYNSTASWECIEELRYDRDRDQQKLYFQGEDFRFCALLIDNKFHHQSWMCPQLIAKGKLLHSQAQTYSDTMPLKKFTKNLRDWTY